MLYETEEGAYEVLPALKDMERAELLQGDSLLFLAYSMSDKILATGEVPLLKLGNTGSSIGDLVLSSANGTKIDGIVSDAKPAFTELEDGKELARLLNNYPNPFTVKKTFR